MDNLQEELERLLNQKRLAAFQIVDWAYTELDEAKSYPVFEQWVEDSYGDGLAYLQGERMKKRERLTSFFSEFQSALVFLFSYEEVSIKSRDFYQSKKSNGLKIASFALGFQERDYHHFLQECLSNLACEISAQMPLSWTLSVDVVPVLERDLAQRSGLGWIGKNSMLISPKHGSFTMIGSILFSTKLPLRKREAISDHCGRCTRCFDACPTHCILPNRTLDAKNCISFFTIEKFKETDPPMGLEANTEIFGCDRCQDICPWNRKLRSEDDGTFNSESSGKLHDFFLKDEAALVKEKIKSLSNKDYEHLFKGTSFERLGKRGMLKNFWWENS